MMHELHNCRQRCMHITNNMHITCCVVVVYQQHVVFIMFVFIMLCLSCVYHVVFNNCQHVFINNMLRMHITKMHELTSYNLYSS